MSNIGNVFGNEGWVQSLIDDSRGKTRPSEKRRKDAVNLEKRQQQTLLDNPMYRKYAGLSPLKQAVTLQSLFGPKPQPKQSILTPNSGTS